MLLDQCLVFAVYLHLLQLACNISLNRYNVVNSQLHNLFHWLIKEISSINNNIIIFHFYLHLECNILCLFVFICLFVLCLFYWINKIIQISILWKISNLGWHLFQLIVLLQPDSNCYNSFTLSSVDTVATGT